MPQPSPPARTAVVIGAGPAGLTAAYELLQRTDIRPIVLEADPLLGGISRTVEVRGNRMDIGGHRFFSKSDRVMDWWLSMLPLDPDADTTGELRYQGRQRPLPAATSQPEDPDAVMLLRQRRSRIFHGGRFFDYPLSLAPKTLRGLGLRRSARIGLSYARARIRPHRDPQNLEQFFIDRFGRELYATFFRDYTEKVWGVPCTEISADWGAQRIKGLSLRVAVEHFLRGALPAPAGSELSQKHTETSLVERFLYPRRGPGQLWERVAAQVEAGGGEVRTRHRVVGIERRDGRVTAVLARTATSEQVRIEADLVISTMPIRDLVGAMDAVPAAVREIASALVYRDFVTVGLLLRGPHLRDARGAPLRDNWIYVQEPGLQVGRLQIFNNWSPWLVADPDTTWLGMEYFCAVGDALWSRSDAELSAMALDELCTMGLARQDDLLDSAVVRMAKTYPAYFGSYGRFDELRQWLDGIDGLYLIGRNGMHRYNNQDHSMLTAMVLVDGLAAGVVDRAAIWAVNTEDEYLEAG
ncbi:MAG: NAD(P)/FAD-dependent oxidoreductase [Alphaproteobacteria bacterium]|nr:NAD(P)/FAD-dependent oxidoreductase [Alphaproteobacteria bacterium]